MRRPFSFRLKEGTAFTFAGIVGEYRYPEGTVIRGCAIITTMPNPIASELHDRMPVILNRVDEPRWLETAENEAPGLTELLILYPAERMEAWEVENRVSTPGIDDPVLVSR